MLFLVAGNDQNSNEGIKSCLENAHVEFELVVRKDANVFAPLIYDENDEVLATGYGKIRDYAQQQHQLYVRRKLQEKDGLTVLAHT